jgi:hypothetical protein
MSKRPQLPLRDRASAEAAIEHVRNEAPGQFPLLFLRVGDQLDNTRTPRRERLLYQLQEYSKRLFMCQARFYKRNAPDETTLRSWLKQIAPLVAKEAIKETSAAFANVRCSVLERQREVLKGLKEEADFWIARYREHWPRLPWESNHPVDRTGPTTSSEEISGGSPKKNNRTQDAMKWRSIKIRFLSDERVQIYREGKSAETCNYAEMGFEDRRQGKPNQAWLLLLKLGQHPVLQLPLRSVPDLSRVSKRRSDGQHEVMEALKSAGLHRGKLQKAVQRARQGLRKYFGIQADPIPFEKRVGYRPQFDIEIGPSNTS